MMRLEKVFSLFLFLASFISAHGSITIKVVNQNNQYSDTNTFFRFESDPSQLDATINGNPLVAKEAYSLAEASNGITLNSFTGGRIFFSLGKPLNDIAYPPESCNRSIPSYFTRFDKIELTYDPTNAFSVANLTAVDFFAIPLSLKTYKKGKLVNTLGCSVDGNTMVKNLSLLTQNNTNVVLSDKEGNFLRVLSPRNTIAYPFYPSLKGYVDSVRESGVPIIIADQYSQDGDTPETQTQKYYFTGTFDENDNLLLQGGGDLIGTNHVIRFNCDELLKGIYTCDPSYLVDANSASIGDNNVYSAVVRDILSGFNLGFVGSTTINPVTGVALQESPSCDWWSSKQAFSYLQPGHTFFSQWTKYVAEDSNAYGFPFSDRWEQVLISLENIDTLEITILPDDKTGQTTIENIIHKLRSFFSEF